MTLPIFLVHLDEYQHEAERTGTAWDDKPIDEHRMLLALGLAGEAGEVLELLKKEIGHGKTPAPMRIAEELGDVLWYLSELARVHGFSLGAVAKIGRAHV